MLYAVAKKSSTDLAASRLTLRENQQNTHYIDHEFHMRWSEGDTNERGSPFNQISHPISLKKKSFCAEENSLKRNAAPHSLTAKMRGEK